MSETGHDLHSEFPEDREILHLLKEENVRFRTLSERHHDLVQEIYRIEDGLAPSSDERLEEMKKERLNLLDEVAAMIADKKTA